MATMSTFHRPIDARTHLAMAALGGMVVVSSALIFRSHAVLVDVLLSHWTIAANLLAGSLSLAVSLPTMLIGFARYSRDGSFQVPRSRRRTVLAMAACSVAGTLIGASWLGVVPGSVLLPLLALILVASALKIWRHDT
jgi:uncharacterized membrane protein YfcA